MSRELTDILRQEIERSGPISCARFMELALYQPTHGFYERSLQQIGCQGHFYTSVSVGPVFGQLLAFQFAHWLQTPSAAAPGRGLDEPLCLVEAGAHDGRLAQDILEALRQSHPALGERIRYWILEPSPRRRGAQQERLHSWAAQLRWIASWSELAAGSVRGIIFSNELLDAFPVHRIGWNATTRAWFEWRVSWQDSNFVWLRSELLTREVESELNRPFWTELPTLLLDMLPDGFTVELSPRARSWWAEAAGCLGEGRLVTCDYGGESLDFLAPRRREGTLRAYRAHRQSVDVLHDPGEQDLTAHVNFSELQEVGEAAGLQTELLESQSNFLTRILQREVDRLPTWSALQFRQFQTLVHPDHLGRAFRFLVQARPPDSSTH